MSALDKQARSVFLDALERGPDEWPPFLAEACGADTALRARVEQLLRAHQAMGSIQGGAADAPAATAADPIGEGPGTVLGPYKLLEQIGEGGFGVVFMAEQTRPLCRKVALKVLKPGMDTRQVVARFEAERQALALMDHPHIARVFDGGETASGRPYFVMELVRGIPITAFCDQNQLSVRQRLELFLSVCQAVRHAHQKGIIHRDLKPSNVLVTLHDGTPVVKVIDFGIAKATGQRLTDKTLFTGFAQMIGTPLYMSPEQAALSGLDVDTRSDIYSLGVLLYELLTGTTPVDRERLSRVGYDELRRIINEEEPPRPSTRISTLGRAATILSTQRQSDPKRLSRLFRGELDWIVMKCLEKDRGRRYDTAHGLANDIERYLRDEPVLACPPSAAYRLRKWLRKHRAAAGGGVALALVLVLLSLGLAANNLRIRREQGRTQAANQRLQDNLKLSLEALDQTLQLLEVRLPRDPEAARENEELLTKAVGFYERFAERNQDDAAVRRDVVDAYLRASDLHLLLGHHDRAETALRQAEGVAAQLTAERPADAEPRWLLAKVHLNRGWLLYTTQGPTPASEDEYRKGIARLESLGDAAALDWKYRETLADLHHGLHWSLLGSGKLPEAEKHGRQAIWLRRRLVNEAEELPRRLAAMHMLALERSDLSVSFSEAQRLDDAEDELREAISLLTRVDAQAGQLPGYRRGRLPGRAPKWDGSPVYVTLAVAHNNLGIVLRRRGRSGAAAREYSQAIELYTRATREWPRDTGFQRNLAILRGNVGLIWFEGGKRAAAAEQNRKAIGLLRTLDAQAPGVDENQEWLGQVLMQMGDLFHAEGNREKAAEHYREVQALTEKRAARSPPVARCLKDLAWFLVVCRDRSFHNPARAVPLAERAVALAPGNADFLNTLGMAQYRQGQWQAAAASLNRARQLRQDRDEGDWLFLAMAHWRLGDRKTARACYDRAGEILKRYEWPPADSGRWQAEAAALLGQSPE
jgi:serine/threonine protein kinase/tetratricopeptide (TPR) repeat protein